MPERRKHARRKAPLHELTLTTYDGRGRTREVSATLVDVSPGGIGVDANTEILEGAVVSVAGELRNGRAAIPVHARARVAGCFALAGGVFRLGLSFEDLGARNPFFQDEEPKKEQEKREKPKQEPPRAEAAAADSFVDCYEVLQLSPNADPDMIHRAYRMLAQRYHPDNRETGNEEAFKLLHAAYDILKDPDQRAAFDIQFGERRRLHWKIFDQSNSAQGPEGEKRKRRGILSLLYLKMIRQPDDPSLTIMELEELLACPREHLQFSLWYLRENAWLARSDNGRFTITAKGVDEAERDGVFQQQPEHRLLTTDTPPAHGS